MPTGQVQLIALGIARYALNPVEVNDVRTVATDYVWPADDLGFESAQAATEKWFNGQIRTDRVVFEVNDRAVIVT